jgi:hypothetical protein
MMAFQLLCLSLVGQATAQEATVQDVPTVVFWCKTPKGALREGAPDSCGLGNTGYNATYLCSVAAAGSPELQMTCRTKPEGPFPAADCTEQCRLANSPTPSPAVVMVPTAVHDCRTKSALPLERDVAGCTNDANYLCQAGDAATMCHTLAEGPFLEGSGTKGIFVEGPPVECSSQCKFATDPDMGATDPDMGEEDPDTGAEDPVPADPQFTTYFVQTASRGKIVASVQADSSVSLIIRLEDMAAVTTWFTDEPAPNAGFMDSEEFISENEVMPPHAVLVYKNPYTKTRKDDQAGHLVFKILN